ncbi:hypothetical protein [Candidatus Pantoea edessiphila]|uniref:hypothetical protein n=1 Tax=Candidatus Pantoea edessiphila TaxID=2044610 RepID=UPI001F543382
MYLPYGYFFPIYPIGFKDINFSTKLSILPENKNNPKTVYRQAVDKNIFVEYGMIY